MSDYGMITGGNYADQACENALSTKMARMPTLKERLEASVRDAEARLADAVRAREILNGHPELEELLNIMQKGRF